jgi:flagellar hook-length control protein FliK
LETKGISLDKSTLISNAANTQLKLLGAPGSTFDALLSQITQMGTTADVAVEMPQQAAPPKIIQDRELSQSTPVEKLEYILTAGGQELDQFEVGADDTDKLKSLLVESGYSDEDAEAIIKRSQDDDGSVNIGTMFKVMQDYTPAETPVLRIAAEDKPQFIQVLKELGLSDETIKKISDSMQLKDGYYELRNMDQILKAAEEAQKLYGYKGSVNKGLVKDLLSQLGLSEDDIATLMEQGSNSEGKISSEAALEILKKAAAKQDKGVSQALKELAAKVKVTGDENQNTETSAADAKRIKNQVNKILQVIDENSNKGQSLKEVVQAALKDRSETTAESQAKDLEQVLGQAAKNPKQVKGAAESANAQDDKQSASQFARQQSSGSQAKTEAASTDAGAKTSSTAKASGQGVDITSGARTADMAKASGPRATVPTYVVRQVSDKIVTMAKNGQNTIKLTLKPAELGGINLELSVKDGVVKATMLADTLAAKNTLDAGSEQLKQMLAQQGLKVEKLDIMLRPDSDDAQAQAKFQDQLDRRSGSGQGKGQVGGIGSGDVDDDEDYASPVTAYAAGSGRISLFA